MINLSINPPDGIESFFTKAMFEAFFPHRNIDGKAEYKIFEYENLIKAAKKFPKFGSEGTLAMRKREVRRLQSRDHLFL